MKRILFVLFLVATGILCAQREETYEEILSRYLGRIEVVDGTNVVIQTREWGGGLLFWRNGWSSYYPVGTGEEEVVRCGESVSFVYSGGPALTVSVDSDTGLEQVNDIFPEGANRMTIRIRDSYRMDGPASMKYDAKLDIVVLPSLGKIYDVLLGRCVDMKFPFKNIWTSWEDMIRYREKQKHVDYSKNKMKQAMSMLLIANEKIESLSLDEDRCCQLHKVHLSPEYGMTNMVAYISDKRKVRAIRTYFANGEIMLYSYSDRGLLNWYIEISRSSKTPSELVGSVFLHFDEMGRIQESLHDNYVPQYLVVSNGTMQFCMDAEKVHDYLMRSSAAFENKTCTCDQEVSNEK